MGLLIIMGIGCTGTVYAQAQLWLENPHKFKRYVFQPGDFIRIQGLNKLDRLSGTIESLSDSQIVLVRRVATGDYHEFYREYVPLSSVTAIYNDQPTYWRYVKNGWSSAATIGGGAIIIGAIVNNTLYQQAPDPESILIAAGIMTTGFIIRHIGRDRYRLGSRWRLRVVSFSGA
ncbi:MAG: hypothetical protein SF053_17255 [Bacteroidia bacterium]|nr:hypothetical protein [Bacteroidia bacterium]